jgi:serine/threonine protein kinase
MGEVYRARDTRLHRDVAIEVLQPAVASAPHRLARFGREAHIPCLNWLEELKRLVPAR